MFDHEGPLWELPFAVRSHRSRCLTSCRAGERDHARSLSQAERFSALQTAMQLFLSPAHHDGTPDEEFSREDADLAIAMTAALVRLAPRWCSETKDDAPDEKET